MGQTLTFIEYISVHKKLTLSGQVCSELLDWQKKKKKSLGFFHKILWKPWVNFWPTQYKCDIKFTSAGSYWVNNCVNT